jgi:hypothetical protein
MFWNARIGNIAQTAPKEAAAKGQRPGCAGSDSEVF